MTKEDFLKLEGKFYWNHNYYFIETNEGNFVYNVQTETVQEYLQSRDEFERVEGLLEYKGKHNVGDYLEGETFSFSLFDPEVENPLAYEYATD